MPPDTRERPGCNPGAPKTLSHQPSATATSLAPSPETRLEAALDYLARGWALLPLKPGRKDPHSRLLPLGWEPLHENAATDEEVRDWFDRFPDINLGIFAGEVSQRLALIDIDFGDKPNSNGAAVPDALREYVESLETPVVWTPNGGLHIYARSGRLAELDNPKRDLSGITVEIKARKGYVVAPPSEVHNGAYRFARRLERLLLASVEEILADLEGLFSKLSPYGPRGNTSSTTSRTQGASKRESPAASAKPENLREARGLERWDAKQEFVEAVIKLLEIPARVDWVRGTSSKFCCILHPERNPSASLFKTQSGVWLYSDHHQKEGCPVYPLVDVYAQKVHGVRRRLTDNQRAKWKLQLLADAGILKVHPSDYELPRLPDDLSADAGRVLAGFYRLQAFTWVDRPEWRGNPSSFARNFAAGWCGLPTTPRFDRARNELVDRGLLVEDGVCVAGKRGRKTKLFNLPAYAQTEGGERAI